MRWRYWAAGLLSAFFLGGCDFIDDPPVRNVAGQVLSAETRAPLAGIPVALNYEVPLLGSQSGIVATGITNSNGRFDISGRSWVDDLLLSVNVETRDAEARTDYGASFMDVEGGDEVEVLLEMHRN